MRKVNLEKKIDFALKELISWVLTRLSNTDFKNSSLLYEIVEIGLHVCITFSPCVDRLILSF